MGDEIPMKIVLKTRAYQITGESYTEVCTAWAKTKGMFDVYADTVITYIGPAEAPTTLAEDVDAKVGRLLAEGLPVDRVPRSRKLAEVEQTIITPGNSNRPTICKRGPRLEMQLTGIQYIGKVGVRVCIGAVPTVGSQIPGIGP